MRRVVKAALLVAAAALALLASLASLGELQPLWADVVMAAGGGRLSRAALQDPLAVCVDGSPAVYYFRAGAETPSEGSTWILDLEGGGWCYDEASCRQRCPEGTSSSLCSSKAYRDEMPVPGGLFRPALLDGGLANAHQAFVPYCTSDAHMGDALSADGRLHFRGARVVKAVLADLVRRGLGQPGKKDRLVFGGQSAGGRGAMIHLDYVVDMLGPAAANVEVLGFLDSPLWVDIPPFAPSGFIGFGEQSRRALEYFHVQHLGASCLAAHAHSANESWKCVMGEYRMFHVRTPYLIVASQYDAFQLGQNKIFLWPSHAQKAYAADLALRTQKLALSLSESWPASAPRPNAVFSWACLDHASSASHRGFDASTCGVGAVTLDVAMRAFLAGRRGDKPLLWMDNCSGYACGRGCHYFFLTRAVLAVA